MKLAILALLLSGCSSISSHPVEIECTGKGIVTWTGTTGAALTADCGDGFSYRSGPPK